MMLSHRLEETYIYFWNIVATHQEEFSTLNNLHVTLFIFTYTPSVVLYIIEQCKLRVFVSNTTLTQIM